MSKSSSEKKKKKSEKSKSSSSENELIYRAPIPLDVYLTSIEPRHNFHNNDYSCGYSNEKVSPDPLLQAIDTYARKIGIGTMLDDEGYADMNPTIRKKFSSFLNTWQVYSSQSPSIYEQMKRDLPALTQPIVLYRGYSQGIDGPQPEISTRWDMGLRSCSLSQAFASKFFTSNNPNSCCVRLDVLPGLYVLPMFRYMRHGIGTEYEIMVPGMLRVHVVDANLIPEGQKQMPAPPVDYKCDNDQYFVQEHDGPLPKVKFFFILSEAGSDIQYHPNFTDQKSNLRVGGGKSIYLNDENKLGFGNPSSIIQKYIASHIKLKSTNHSPLKKQMTSKLKYEPLNLYKQRSFMPNAIAAGGRKSRKK